ncbi:YtxH domain-containing protein [Desulfurispirillum indicum]|uniref:Uncharacterized protein n=1 Tax=Desulfurispirillum indicum (strain ATCC BAA-1389 / DSM 22839 / S5) TaxID=653733 RepID=E6W2K0_DESIS|nr:YtxH domain-containing protein [Desulfurispirillum indicum]ADU66750.1 hypothetical protein Selin_2030 [Desulfurispirillum indicum S5]UCZ56072.1 YtxH domain-containing protein [Desulfurispirillum indicum]
MAYHFVLGAVVGAAAVLLLNNRRTREYLDRGQLLLKENVDEGIKAARATAECIREKMQTPDDEHQESKSAADASAASELPATTEEQPPAKRSRRTRKPAADE